MHLFWIVFYLIYDDEKRWHQWRSYVFRTVIRFFLLLLLIHFLVFWLISVKYVSYDKLIVSAMSRKWMLLAKII